MSVDLHVHTRASDGCFSPEGLVLKALARGLTGIAITDHDTVGGVARALRAGHRWGLDVIPGIELSTQVGEKEFHILGYYIDYRQPQLQLVLANLCRARLLRIRRMTKKLRKLGLDLSWSRVVKIAGRGAVGRPHLARAMLEKGYVSSIAEAFNHYLGRDCPAYVPRPKFTPPEAIRLVHSVGGIPVLAHPGWIEERWVKRFIAAGLRGLEVYHPQHDARTASRMCRMAHRYGLLITGGSDFHGDKGGRFDLGTSLVGKEVVDALKEASLYRPGM
ncbi:MAG: PHP domain-containing protein [Firmicutes bacterium]|nr:PHP domain-containing protein [Bacillota bacterium]